MVGEAGEVDMWRDDDLYGYSLYFYWPANHGDPSQDPAAAILRMA
jgi:hypothetical protein